jgi:predicted HAD superfamily Cof-like phosphohydrolase
LTISLDRIWLDVPAITLVAEFHEAFGHPITNRPASSEDLNTDLGQLRLGLIQEEFEELTTAWRDGDLIGVIDALQDLKYVIYGAELALGICAEEHFGEVHDANMRKLGPDGKPIYREDGKVLKPEDWFGPDHESLLAEISDRDGLY